MNSRSILIIILIFLATPLWMRIAWELGNKKALNLLIVDKTVLNSNSFKHRSVNWILDYEKYTKSNGLFYDINKDYYGFFPSDNEKYNIQDFEKMNETDLDSMSSIYDMVYFTDTYGILGNEWYKHRDRNENSESIYGGLSEKDILLLKKMKERNKPIISEFNTVLSTIRRFKAFLLPNSQAIRIHNGVARKIRIMIKIERLFILQL